jgi:hypothetical protein
MAGNNNKHAMISKRTCTSIVISSLLTRCKKAFRSALRTNTCHHSATRPSAPVVSVSCRDVECTFVSRNARGGNCAVALARSITSFINVADGNIWLTKPASWASFALNFRPLVPTPPNHTSGGDRAWVFRFWFQQCGSHTHE